MAETDKELLLRVAERMDNALKFFIKPIIVSRDEAHTISRVLREAAEGAAPVSPPAESGEVERLREELAAAREALVMEQANRVNAFASTPAPQPSESGEKKSDPYEAWTICHECGAHLPQSDAQWSDDGSPFCKRHKLNDGHAPQPADHRRVQDAAPARHELDALIAEANAPQPTQPGEAVKVKALAERAGTLLRGLEQWPEDRHPSFSKGDWGEIKAVIAEAAAIEPSPLGWNAGAFEAGAKAMLLEALSAARSAIVTSGLDRHACIIADDAITQAIRALPLPTPPAGEG